jgi:pimeloyl-ACP methyl ester carboxylesterase
MLFFQLPWLPETLMSAGDFALIERAFKTTVARPGSFTDADIAVYKKALREPFALTAAVNYYRANFTRLFLKRPKATEELSDGRIPVPTLFIYGEQDHAIVPETVRGVGDFIDAPYREVRIPTSAHWVQNEAFAEVNAALKSFLDDA